jgi:hypothetical protein
MGTCRDLLRLKSGFQVINLLQNKILDIAGWIKTKRSNKLNLLLR